MRVCSSASTASALAMSACWYATPSIADRIWTRSAGSSIRSAMATAVSTSASCWSTRSGTAKFECVACDHADEGRVVAGPPRHVDGFDRRRQGGFANDLRCRRRATTGRGARPGSVSVRGRGVRARPGSTRLALSEPTVPAAKSWKPSAASTSASRSSSCSARLAARTSTPRATAAGRFRYRAPMMPCGTPVE